MLKREVNNDKTTTILMKSFGWLWKCLKGKNEDFFSIKALCGVHIKLLYRKTNWEDEFFFVNGRKKLAERFEC